MDKFLLLEVLQNFFDGNLRAQKFKIHFQTKSIYGENIIKEIHDIVPSDAFLPTDDESKDSVYINPDFLEFDNYFNIRDNFCMTTKTKTMSVSYFEDEEMKTINGYCRILFVRDNREPKFFHYFEYKGENITLGIYLTEEDFKERYGDPVPQRNAEGRIVLPGIGSLTKSTK